jgi:hypothetical protein
MAFFRTIHSKRVAGEKRGRAAGRREDLARPAFAGLRCGKRGCVFVGHAAGWHIYGIHGTDNVWVIRMGCGNSFELRGTKEASLSSEKLRP